MYPICNNVQCTRRLWLMCAIIVGLAGGTLPARADSEVVVKEINVNLSSNMAISGESLNGTSWSVDVSPLPYSGTVWNDFTVAATTVGSDLAYSDSPLGSSGIGFTISGLRNAQFGQPTSLEMLQGNGYSPGGLTFTISGLPPAPQYDGQRFDLYIASAAGVYEGGIFTLDSQVLTTDHSQVTSWVDGVNYVVFRDLPLDGSGQVSISVDPNPHLSIISGFQLAEVDETIPAILFCSPSGVAGGWIDLKYLNELHARGYEVDYTESLADVTLDRLREYNAAVIYATPETLSHVTFVGVPGSTQATVDFVNAVTQYVSEGGGVLLAPWEVNRYKQAVHDFTSIWGASLPVERIVETNSGNLTNLDHMAYPTPIAWTDNIPFSPVSGGVNELWYPVAPAYNAAHGGPIEVDANWQVAARASATAHTQSINLSGKNDALLHAEPSNPPIYQPPLMAVRSVGAGRVALMNQWPQYTIGSGVKWLFDRQVLSRGADTRASDWERLLDNTYDWLASPSLASGSVGGYVTPEERLQSPNEQPGAIDWYLNQASQSWEDLTNSWGQPAQYAAPRPGLIGAKTWYSSGSNSVAEYKAAALAAGLQFVVFLDDFAQLTEAEFDQLTAECHALSDSQILLIPGYTIDANTGDHLFIYGENVPWPTTDVLTGVNNELLNLQPQNASGLYTGHNGASFSWLLYTVRGNSYHGANVGYYNFTNSPASYEKKMKVSDLRLFGAAAIHYYRDGALVEDVTSNYLTCAQGTIPPAPVSFNEVRSTSELAQEVSSGHALTYVPGYVGISQIFSRGLYWTGMYETLDVAVSDGPLIHRWAVTERLQTLGGEQFVTAPSVMASRLEVSAANGLQELAIYDGEKLFRRIELSGQTQYSANLMLSKAVQRNLVLIVTDQVGRQAVGMPRRCWKEGARAVIFCSDRANDCLPSGARTAHGPSGMLLSWAQSLHYDIAGYAWDGASPSVSPIRFRETRPRLVSTAGVEDGKRFNQTPLLDFTDEGAAAIRSRQDELFSDNLVSVVTAHHTFGPLAGPSQLFKAVLRNREYVAPTLATPTVGWASLGIQDGIKATLFESDITFLTNTTVTNLTLLRHEEQISVSPIYCAHGDWPANVSGVVNVSALSGTQTLALDTNQWFAFYTPEGVVSEASVFLVRDRPILLDLNSDTGAINVRADLSTGAAVSEGETWEFELFSLGVPVNQSVKNTNDVLELLAYLDSPAGLQIQQGTRATSPGFVELTPSNYAVELSIPAPSVSVLSNDLAVPLRVNSLNPRWTAGLWQIEGYVKDDYGFGATNRWREVGVDDTGYAYVPMYVTLASNTHHVVGHPITASGEGADCFIQVTHLYDNPHHWYAAINNPLDHAVVTTLSKTMDLPGLDAPPPVPITLDPGEYRVLQAE